MIFIETCVLGANIISLELKSDNGGSFSRSFCVNEIANDSLEINYNGMVVV